MLLAIPNFIDLNFFLFMIFYNFYLFKQMMISNQRLYSIGTKEEGYSVNEVYSLNIHASGKSCRKVFFKPSPLDSQPIFHDLEFEINIEQYNKSNSNRQISKSDKLDKPDKLSLRRIFQFYDKEFNLFSEEYYKPIHLELPKNQENLPTFLSEFSMIDREYIQTRFVTKTVNAKGYYQYFVRRNGEYYVEFIDDIIPVHGDKQLPIWGLSLKEPWKLIIMKAWLKERGGIQGVINAKPYQFIDAFGFPGYRAIFIKKEIDFIKTSYVAEHIKQLQRQRIRFNYPGFITVGKTRDEDIVASLGLQRNRAAYKIVPIYSSALKSNRVNNIEDQQNLYKVSSELPCFWKGEYSVAGKKITQKYNSDIHKLNIENEFLATYSEISQVFGKFYIAPEYSSKYFQRKIIEDSIRLPINYVESLYFLELEIQVQGHLNLNIELPEHQRSGDYPYLPIKYFLAKEKPQDKKGAKELKEYQLYDGEYMKGYHKSINRFLQISTGKYYIFIKITENNDKAVKNLVINISTNALVGKFEQANELTKKQISNIIKSSLYNYGLKAGVRCYVHKEVRDLIVYICKQFDELGFAFISLFVDKKASGMLAMNVDYKKLQQSKIQICAESFEKKVDMKNFKLVARPGETQILVLEKTDKNNTKDEQFPPKDSIDFYEIY